MFQGQVWFACVYFYFSVNIPANAGIFYFSVIYYQNKPELPMGGSGQNYRPVLLNTSGRRIILILFRGQ